MEQGLQTLKEVLDKSISELELYVVMNSTGQFFRAKGYGGYGNTWVNDIKKAKTYSKIGQARSRVTWFSNTYPQYPPPSILEFKIGSYKILNELERVLKARKTKEEKEAIKRSKQAKLDFNYAKAKLEKAEEELKRTRSILENSTNKNNK
jgi:hypothetical protein